MSRIYPELGTIFYSIKTLPVPPVHAGAMTMLGAEAISTVWATRRAITSHGGDCHQGDGGGVGEEEDRQH